MENKEFTYSGVRINGFAMLFLNLLLTFGAIGLIVFGIMTGPWPFVAGVVLLIISLNVVGDGLRDALDPRLRGKL